MTDDSWDNYRKLVETRLQDLKLVEQQMHELKSQFSALQARVLILSTLIGGVMPFVIKFISGR